MEDHASEKKERLLAALDSGMVMVHLDARRPGVVVPSHLARMAHLHLNLSYNFPGRDLTVDGWGICSTLSFSGERFRVSIPWSALFGICSHVSHEEWLFPDDLPAELAGMPVPVPPIRRRVVARAVALREIPGERRHDSNEDGGETDRPCGRGHLRVVK
jgi:stringent starvation protein B